MCGIAGLVVRTDERADDADVHRMCQKIVHRGPDDEGIFTQGPVGLGMRRLSIIDVAGGHQPIHNEDKTVWVVFNGEIYNFPDLRRELQARGHCFYTHSDTEVIVHLYEEMGSDFVQKLRGMFAIALYDLERKVLLLARDRLGKKPLHYAIHRGQLLFGSEIKAILALRPELAQLSGEGLLQYFYFGYITDPHTVFETIHKLPPGHLLEWRDGSLNVRPYWDLPAYGTRAAISEEQCLEELEQQLAEAVRIRMISDVPLGALLSGGVDSSVAAALTHRAIGDQLTCIFVDNGVLRAGERDQVEKTFASQMHLNMRILDRTNQFLAGLKNVTDPERKRKIIGRQFIRNFEEESKKLKGIKYLVQGTLYPDVIESVSFKGPSATIKTHHNVGGLPARMKMKLIEPLRELFKDEVRVLGQELGLPDEIIWRQPFPGPGLAIRVLGSVTKERLAILRAAETIVDQEIRSAGLYREIWQAFAVLLPIRTVGVMGDQRTYDYVIAIRAVTSLDGMTADWAKIPDDVLGKMSNRIINEVKGVNRVVYDISSKPPATIEWE